MRRLFCLFAVLLLCCARAAAFDYHGFLVDEGAAPLASDARSSLIGQLDIVEAAGLPPAVLAALKQTPVVVAPQLRGNPGVFAPRGATGTVFVRPIVFDAGKPILLHEFLHAYHFRVLGLDRPEIERAYRLALQAGVFPPRFQAAHFLENAKEFFAVSGTLYLFGDIQQPPFRCAALAQLDADYLAFLASQFGPHQCPPVGAVP